jgi:hypothetical protein
VLSVDGHPADEVLATIEPLISRDNDQQVALEGPELLRRTPLIHALGLISDPSGATLTVRFPDQTTATVVVEPVVDPHPSLTDPRPADWISLPDIAGPPMPLYLRNSGTPYWFEYLPAESVVYFQFNGVRDQPSEPMAAFCERLFTFIDSHQWTRLDKFLVPWRAGYSAVCQAMSLAGQPGAPLRGAHEGGAFPPNGTFGWTLCHPKVPLGGNQARAM